MNKAKYTVLTMEDNKRVCVAAIIAAVSSSRDIHSVYDFYRGQYHIFSTSINGNQFSVYDYTRGGYMQGSIEQVYDFVSASYISIRINGNSFSGYDYERGFYFNGHVNSGNISFYDYENSGYFNYASS